MAELDPFQAEIARLARVAPRVAAKLEEAGFAVQTITGDSDDLSGFIEGFHQDMIEFEVSRDGQIAGLQLVRFDRSRTPVMMEIGPVLHIDDVLGSKVAALVTRAEPRDYIDVAHALRTHSRQHLMELAYRADPGLQQMEFTDAMRRLDRLDDADFLEQYRLPPEQVQHVRAAFTDWPR